MFPKKQLKIYPLRTGDLAGSWLPAARRVGVGGPRASPSQSWSRSGRGGRQSRDWAQHGASSGLSCRGGHRWEPIAFCPAASRARAAQGGRASGLCHGQVLLHQAREGDAAPPDHCSCPILGLLGPGGRLGLTFLPPGRDGDSCKTAGHGAVQAAVFADPTPAPGALAGRERTPAPSQGSPTEAQRPRLPWVWSNQQRGTRPRTHREGAWVVEIKGRRPGDAGQAPSPGCSPPAQAGCCPQIPRPTAKPLPGSGCISRGGGRGVVTARGGRTTSPGNLSEGAGMGPAARPPPRRTPIANKPNAALPTALNLAWELITCPCWEGKAPTGGPAAPPGLCQAAIRPRVCTAAAGCGSLPGTKASTQPGTGPGGMQGSRDAQIRSIPRGSRAQALWDALPGVTACRDRSEHPVPDR